MLTRVSLPYVVFGILALLIVGFVVYLRFLRPPSPPAGVQVFEVESRNHVTTDVVYAQIPPVGGDHSPDWQNCGFYGRPVRNENAVHSLEHGAVWITYQPDLQPDPVNRIRQFAVGQTYVLASPYPNLPSPVVVSAWGRQLRLDSAEDPKLEQFIRAFRGAATAPEPGAPCGGGVGTPR